MSTDNLSELASDQEAMSFADSFMALRSAIASEAVLRRRELQAREELEEQARSSMSSALLQVLDVVDRLDGWLSDESLAEVEEGSPVLDWVSRMQRVQKMLVQLLAKSKVTPIDLNDAVPGVVTVDSRIVTDDVEKETIVEVLQRGWLWKGEVLRKAVVTVAVPSAKVKQES